MKVAFRLDAWAKIGFGHLFRSIAIAKELAKFETVQILFVGFFNDIAINVLVKEHIDYMIFPEGTDEQELIDKVKEQFGPEKIFIDNLYDYSPDFIFDIKLNARIIMFHNTSAGSYAADTVVLPIAHGADDLIKTYADKRTLEFYYGPEYVVISNEIKKVPRKVSSAYNDSGLSRILVLTGGSDPNGVMIHLAELIKECNFEYDITLLPGKSFMHSDKLNEILPLPGVSVKEYNTSLLAESDIVICAFGVTAYELMYLGIPFLSTGHIPKTAEAARVLSERYDLNNNLGYFAELDSETLCNSVKNFVSNRKNLSELSEKIQSLIDDKGAQRVAAIIYNS